MNTSWKIRNLICGKNIDVVKYRISSVTSQLQSRLENNIFYLPFTLVTLFREIMDRFHFLLAEQILLCKQYSLLYLKLSQTQQKVEGSKQLTSQV